MAEMILLVVHATHEAGVKLGGIGAVLDGLLVGFQSLGRLPEPNPALIREHLRFTSDLSQWRHFSTLQFRSVRSFETNSAREDIFPNPEDAATSRAFLKLRLPRDEKLNDIVELAVVHRWFYAGQQPTGIQTSLGNFYCMESS